MLAGTPGWLTLAGPATSATSATVRISSLAGAATSATSATVRTVAGADAATSATAGTVADAGKLASSETADNYQGSSQEAKTP
jgi:hypothetical protein